MRPWQQSQRSDEMDEETEAPEYDLEPHPATSR